MCSPNLKLESCCQDITPTLEAAAVEAGAIGETVEEKIEDFLADF